MRAEIRFSQNFNNKLACEYFTTYRLKEDNYRIGETFSILLNNKLIYYADIIDIEHTFLDNVSDVDAMLDMGVTAAEFRRRFRVFYKDIDFKTRAISKIVLKRLPNQRDMAKKQTSEAATA